MLLRSARIENFRAVKGAQVSFDPTTVLIGENDCGRSSIMEAVALALGWNSKSGEFQFQPFHFHRPMREVCSTAPAIRIELEFGESRPGEWDRDDFEMLRSAWPGMPSRERRFWLNVTHAEGSTEWIFRSTCDSPFTNDEGMLAWLRRRMPVFWLSEGMVVRKSELDPVQLAGTRANDLAEEVSRNYRDLLQGSALDISGAIEAGSEAAREFLLAQAKLLPHQVPALGEILEGMMANRRPRPAATSPLPAESSGTAAHKIGMLLLVGAFLRSGAAHVEQGMDPLTLIENPEANLHPMTLASTWGLLERIRGQKIIATHSGMLLASARLSSVRRLTRHDGAVREWRVPEGALNADDLRRYTYHLRSRRAAASFARCWLLVEGETEFWLMPEVARACGYDFASEGVACVEFAQCGLAALIKVALHLGIEWHVLADGDVAGRHYVEAARQFVPSGNLQDRVTLLREPDVEHCFWRNGYQDVFHRAASAVHSSTDAARQGATAGAVIKRAIQRHSKPYVAVLLLDALLGHGPKGVPPPLKRAIETCVRLARRGPQSAHA